MAALETNFLMENCFKALTNLRYLPDKYLQRYKIKWGPSSLGYLSPHEFKALELTYQLRILRGSPKCDKFHAISHFRKTAVMGTSI